MLEELRANLARVTQILGVHSVGAALDYRPVLGRSRLRVVAARAKELDVVKSVRAALPPPAPSPGDEDPKCLAISINVQNV